MGVATFRVLRVSALPEGSTTVDPPGAGVARRRGLDAGSMGAVLTALVPMVGPTGVVLTGDLTAGKEMIQSSEQPLTMNRLRTGLHEPPCVPDARLTAKPVKRRILVCALSSPSYLSA